MATLKITPRPYHYTLMEIIDEACADAIRKAEAERDAQPKGRMQISFEVISGCQTQRELATMLAEKMNAMARFKKDYTWHSVQNKGYYDVAGWTVNGSRIQSPAFFLKELPTITQQMKAFSGMKLASAVLIHCRLEKDTIASLQHCLNALTILEARRELLEMALVDTAALSEKENELKIIYDNDLALSLPLGAFDLPKVEAAICVLHQAVCMGEATGKARMKPCDMSNPKYQMRTWLLRLGFIGDTFENARHTLLDGLDGNAAYFNETSKDRAEAKRHSKNTEMEETA